MTAGYGDWPNPNTPPGNLRQPTTKFKPVSGTRAPKARKAEPTTTRTAKLGSTRVRSTSTGVHARAARATGAPRLTSRGAGGHRIAVTAAQRASFVYIGQGGNPLIAGVLATIDVAHAMMSNGLVLGYPSGNPPLGFDNPAPTATHLGHHPLADGTTQNPSSRFHPHLGSGTIISFDSGSATAVMRMGDTPDSPIIAVPLVNGVDPSLMAPGKLGLTVQPSPIDHTQATIAAYR